MNIEEPKAIQYYRQQGFTIRACKKVADKKSEGSRIANTRKMKRFVRIICSADCKPAIMELQDLTYKKRHDGSLDYGHFNIDSHVLSSLWYACDTYEVSNLKARKNNSVRGV